MASNGKGHGENAKKRSPTLILQVGVGSSLSLESVWEVLCYKGAVLFCGTSKKGPYFRELPMCISPKNPIHLFLIARERVLPGLGLRDNMSDILYRIVL